MKAYIRRILYVLLILAALVLGYINRQSLFGAYQRLAITLGISTPCQQTIYYSIGRFDTGFGLTKNQFLTAAKTAADLWEAPVKLNMLEYKDDGQLKLNLVYDYRQQATIKMQQLGIVIKDDRVTYDTVKAKYASLSAEYNDKKVAYEQMLTAYNARKQAYEAKVAYWNDRGGAPKADYNLLEDERRALDAEAASINQSQSEINDLVSTLNATVTVLNQLVRALNLKVNDFNTVGQSTGEEFDAGEFTSSASGEAITVYQYDDMVKLVRVLAHEFGHALGLEHIDNPKAIMYRLNAGQNGELTADDVAALKKICHI